MTGPQSSAPGFVEGLLAGTAPLQSRADDFYLAIVDGTGPFRDSTYQAEMYHSFCSQLHRLSGGRSSYKRGPSAEGIKMGVRADWAIAELEPHMGKRRLMLAGYSRGASAVIMAAERLEKRGVRVDSMFLFDPVARHLTEGGEVIPANVDYVAVVRRRLDPGLVERSGRILPSHPAMVLAGSPGIALYAVTATYNYVQNPMRTWFGFTGTTYLGPKENMEEASFAGTHGAIGGVGTADVPEDKQVQELCADWMSKRLAKRKVPILLVAVPPKRQ